MDDIVCQTTPDKMIDFPCASMRYSFAKLPLTIRQKCCKTDIVKASALILSWDDLRAS